MAASLRSFANWRRRVAASEVVGAFGAHADERSSPQEGDDDIPAEGSGQDLIDGTGHLVGTCRKLNPGEDVVESEAVGHPALPGGEHVGELTRSGEDPFAQCI